MAGYSGVICSYRVRYRRPRQVSLKLAPLFMFCALLCSCAHDPVDVRLQPSLEFTRVPLAGAGGPDKLDSIEGRVTHVQLGQRIVLYAQWGPWWVQPLADQPFTAIQPDLTWRSPTHFGVEYAALLVNSDYHPPAKIDALPSLGAGVVVVAVTRGRPVFWQTWWFVLSTAAALAVLVSMLVRMRMQKVQTQLALRLEERLAERTRIAQELHDTLLQGFLSASMQLHVADDHLPLDSPAKPILARVLELMGQVIDEGRNAVRGLRTKERPTDLEQAFTNIREEFPAQSQLGFRVIVEGTPVLLRPTVGHEIYRIGREALSNAFRHSHASDIELELEYAPGHLRVLIRDNGDGIDPQVLLSGLDGHWGLSGMKERTERIGGRLRVLSNAGGGTEVELSVPGQLAFEETSSRAWPRWFPKLFLGGSGNGDSQTGERPK